MPRKPPTNNQRRGNSAQRGYDHRWRAARLVYLQQHPFCAHCSGVATVVDHVVPHRGNQELFWRTDNWQPLCSSCHSTKTRQGQ